MTLKILLIMEDFNVYTNNTSKDLREEAIKAMNRYYDTFDEIETVRVNPRLQVVKKRLKLKRDNNRKSRR